MNATTLSLRFVHFPWPRRWAVQFSTRPQLKVPKDYPPDTLWHDWLIIGPPLRRFWRKWSFYHTVHLKIDDTRYGLRCWFTDGADDRLWVDGVTEQWAAVRAGWMRAA